MPASVTRRLVIVHGKKTVDAVKGARRFRLTRFKNNPHHFGVAGEDGVGIRHAR